MDFLGNFYMTNTTEMVFGTLDADKSVSIELKHDDKLPADSNIYIQVNDTTSGTRFSHSCLFNRSLCSIRVSLVNVV